MFSLLSCMAKKKHQLFKFEKLQLVNNGAKTSTKPSSIEFAIIYDKKKQNIFTCKMLKPAKMLSFCLKNSCIRSIGYSYLRSYNQQIKTDFMKHNLKIFILLSYFTKSTT